ncbi:hypothetical protein Bca101_057576 [Brassica carinata]
MGATHFPLTSHGGPANSTTGESGPSPDLTPGVPQRSSMGATHFPLTSNGGAANSTTGESGPSPDLTPGSTQTSVDATQNTSVRELRL